MRIRITVGDFSMEAELNETVTARKVAEALPLRSSLNTWGDEIYFGIPVEADLDESAQEIVKVGDLGFWPSGNAFCIFFGQTPMSTPEEIRPASAVNIIGKMIGDATALKGVMHEREVLIEST
jgi:hypothetical protein